MSWASPTGPARAYVGATAPVAPASAATAGTVHRPAYLDRARSRRDDDGRPRLRAVRTTERMRPPRWAAPSRPDVSDDARCADLVASPLLRRRAARHDRGHAALMSTPVTTAV